jgi:plasmid stability protein
MATITVKGIPDNIYNRLKGAAETNRRSMNSEIISLIEQSLMSRRVPARKILERVQRLHDSFGGKTFDNERFEKVRRTGRP